MTDKEKKLLLSLGLILVVVLYYFTLYKPIEAKRKNLLNEFNQLDSQLTVYQMEYLNKDNLLEQIKEKEDFIAEVEKELPADLTQEMIIYVMKDIETQIESLSIPNYSIGTKTLVASDGQTIDPNTSAVVFSDNLISVPVTLEVNLNYADYKKLLTMIRDYPQKLSITQMNVSSDLTENTVNTSFLMNFYGLMSEGRTYTPIDYFGEPIQKADSIFRPYAGYGLDFVTGMEEALVVTAEADDIVMTLSPIISDRSTTILEAEGDDSGTTQVYSDNAGDESVEIVFNQVGSKYYYKYKTGDRQYPSDYGTGVLFEPGKVINLKVYSSLRNDEEDLSTASLVLVNNTDLVVDIQVDSDDPERPRLNVKTTSGEYTINRFID